MLVPFVSFLVIVFCFPFHSVENICSEMVVIFFFTRPSLCSPQHGFYIIKIHYWPWDDSPYLIMYRFFCIFFFGWKHSDWFVHEFHLPRAHFVINYQPFRLANFVQYFVVAIIVVHHFPFSFSSSFNCGTWSFHMSLNANQYDAQDKRPTNARNEGDVKKKSHFIVNKSELQSKCPAINFQQTTTTTNEHKTWKKNKRKKNKNWIADTEWRQAINENQKKKNITNTFIYSYRDYLITEATAIASIAAYIKSHLYYYYFFLYYIRSFLSNAIQKCLHFVSRLAKCVCTLSTASPLGIKNIIYNMTRCYLCQYNSPHHQKKTKIIRLA